MAAAFDFLTDIEGDNELLFSDGDLSLGASDEQHIRDTINGHAGWDKQFPTDGVGIRNYVKGSGIEQKLQRSVKTQLSLDGYDFIKSPRAYFAADGQLILQPNAIRR